ncbi:MAG TPA: hypothetical protein VMW27_03795 [Thermoanaerobaculia bacterium]|nr:hypothetical protein [Thermoanaerobaculia bacterium]
MRSKPFRWMTVPLLAALAALPVAAEVQPLGDAFRVNRTNDFKQQNPVAAFSPSGTALVVWENDQNGLRGIFQRLDGTPVSAELALVANNTLNGQYEGLVRTRKDPTVAFLSSGHFLLAWTEERAYLRSYPFFENRQVEDREIFIQRFDAAGAPAGPRHRVNSIPGMQSVPKIAVLPDGNAVVLWKSDGPTPGRATIMARLVQGMGQPAGPEIQVTTDATADHAAIAAGRNGFLVVWDALVNGEHDIFGRLYDTAGRSVGNDFRVSAAEGWQRWPAAAAGKDGNFLVAWHSFTTDRSIVRIHGQFVSPQGGFLGEPFRISTDEGTGQLAPALAPTPSGGFIAAWLDWSDAGLGINAVELGATGSRIGDEFWVSEARVQKNYRTSIAANGQGGFLIPWETIATKRQVIVARPIGQ